MSVRTEADENLDDVKEHVDLAFRCLGKILVEKCDGHDGYSDLYRNKLRAAFRTLMDLEL